MLYYTEMSKAAAPPTSSDKVVRNAKRLFFVSLFDLSWRLLGAILLPLFVGMYIDSKRAGGQGFATAGFLIGMGCGILVMRSVVRKLAAGGNK
jgi:F0F1-type ATP synthase assembly protein I